MPASSHSHITVLGGGTGTYTILTGLKRRTEPLTLSAAVSMADSGGSTGRLRDEFGYLPVGDVRQALAALAEDDGADNVLRELFTHRFNTSGAFAGHNVGNLLLMALTDMYGSEAEAVAAASRILRVTGTVVPVTETNTHLVARYADGTQLSEETHIDEPPADHDGTQRITDIWLAPAARITDRADTAIRTADAIVLGPGDVYTSTIATLAVSGVPAAIQESAGTLVYVVNLMTKYGQTHGFTAADHVREIERYAGRTPDVVIMNNAPLPDTKLTEYAAEHGYPVADDLGEPGTVFRADMLAAAPAERKAGDTLVRSLIRHDPDKLADAIMRAIGKTS